MKPRILLLLAAPALLGASAPVEQALRTAAAELRTADAEQRRLDRLAASARGEADRLRSEQAAAAAAIVGAEARISAADAEHRLALARLETLEARLERRQRPVTSLLAGLAMMGRRPPLLALADGSSADEMVRVRLLLDSTLPVIRKRAASLTAEIEGIEQLQRRSLATRDRLAASREALRRKQQAFAELEGRALRRAEVQGAGALSAGDVALAAGEQAELLSGDARSAREAAGIARELELLGPAALRPSPSASVRVPIRYRLPAAAPVTGGFGAISKNGVRSRGIVLATRRGSPLVVPASGIVRFAGPFRDYDGIVIVDHGEGWMSMILNVASPLKRGTRLRIGDPLGRALGPIEVELSRNGHRMSPALIAGSSASLSKRPEGG